MVNTEIFKDENINNYTVFENVLKLVNDFIKKHDITKDNILEYKTNNYLNNDGKWVYRVIISYWY